MHTPFHLERAGRQARNAVLRLTGGLARLYVHARDGRWYLQQPVQVSADGVALAAAVLGTTSHGPYAVVAVKTDAPGTRLETLPEGERSNVVRFVVRKKDVEAG